MIKLNIYSSKGVKKGTTSLPKEFMVGENMKLLAQALRVYEDRRHPGLAKTKTRAEVDISKRKIYRQKGTGYARHGAKSAPIFVGGGIAHGPKGVKRVLQIPQKMAKMALRVAFLLKAKEGKLAFVDGLSGLKKTKEGVDLINKIRKSCGDLRKDSKITFAISKKNWESVKALRNIENLETVAYESLNAYKVYFGGLLLVDREVFGADKPAVRQARKNSSDAGDKISTRTQKTKTLTQKTKRVSKKLKK